MMVLSIEDAIRHLEPVCIENRGAYHADAIAKVIYEYKKLKKELDNIRKGMDNSSHAAD